MIALELVKIDGRYVVGFKKSGVTLCTLLYKEITDNETARQAVQKIADTMQEYLDEIVTC